jgi:hypothetical protein
MLFLHPTQWSVPLLSPPPPQSSFLFAGVPGAYRAFTDVLSSLQLRTRLQMWADAFIGRQTATPDGGGTTSPSTQITSPESPTPNNDTRPGGVTATPEPPTASSGHHDIAHAPPV